MKFTVKRDSFLRALQRVQGTVEKSGVQPILANVLIQADAGEVTVSASDLEMFARDICEAEVSKGGGVTVNARKLFEITKGLPAEDVSVEAGKDSRVEVKAGRSRFKLPGLPEKDFPSPPELDPAALSRVAADFLRDMIDKTYFAVSTDVARENINGFRLTGGEDTTRMVATDGHRLAIVERPGRPGGKRDASLPRKGVLEMRKLLGEAADEVLFGMNGKRATLMAGNAAISVRLLEGEFPDYEKVIPRDNDRVVLAPRAGLLDSIRRVALLAEKKGHGVRFTFRPGSLTVSASCPEIGEASEDLDIKYDGPETEAAFNAVYFADALEAMPGEAVRLLLKNGLSPALVRPEASDDYTCIIMPMRL